MFHSFSNDKEKFHGIKKIEIFIFLSFISTFIFSMVLIGINDSKNIKPETFMDPCCFTDMLPLYEITSLKSKINILREKICTINEILPYKLSEESEEKLQYFSTFYEDSINEIYTKLEYQKFHRQKCYSTNLNIHLQHLQNISRIVILLSLPIFAFIDFTMIYHYEKKPYNNELMNEEENSNEKSCICGIALALAFNIVMISVMIYSCFFSPPEIDKKFIIMPVF